jgi:CRISPR/Cas system-associated protein Csx1
MNIIEDKELIELIGKLPQDLRGEVKNFIKHLLQKQENNKKLKLQWAGRLSKYKNIYTSLELEKKSLEWREDT